MPEKPELSYKQTLQMRRTYLGKSCKLHFDVKPMKIVRGSKQYLYDDCGNEFLDCISNVSHVGHCHPHVVHAGQEQMAKLTTCTGFLNDKMVEYCKRIIATLPDNLCVCFFLNSGSEANDLALRMAKAYTGNDDVIVIDNAYHGNIEQLLEISPCKWKKCGIEQKEWVHTVPCPDTYRGKYREDSVNPGILYANEVRDAIFKAKANGRRIGAFFSEPLLAQCGLINPPDKFLKYAYRYVREAGGLCIADEVQVGLGRTGEGFFSFQNFDVVPDIVTVGKPLGNGHPMALVVTTKEIADSIGDYSSTFGGNPVACAVGLAVLDVIKNEQLISSAKSVGKCLLDGFRAILPNHPMMGDVRGIGLAIGVEIVMDKESRKPAKEAAEILAYKMKEKKIIISNEGPDKNVMFLLPPMCFTCDNARRVVQAMDIALSDIEKGASEVGLTKASSSSIDQAEIQVPLDILSAESSQLSDSDDEPDSKRARYDDVD